MRFISKGLGIYWKISIILIKISPGSCWKKEQPICISLIFINDIVVRNVKFVDENIIFARGRNVSVIIKHDVASMNG